MGAERGMQTREPGEPTDPSVRDGASQRGNGMTVLQIDKQSLEALVLALQHDLPLKPGPRPATGAGEVETPRTEIRRAGNRPTRDENSHGQPPT